MIENVKAQKCKKVGYMMNGRYLKAAGLTLAVIINLNFFNVAIAQQAQLGSMPFNIKIGDLFDVNMGFTIDNGEISGVVEEQISKTKINIDGKAKNNTPGLTIETYQKGKKTAKYNGEINNNKLSGNLNGMPANITLPFALPKLIPGLSAPATIAQALDGQYIMDSKNLNGNLTLKKLDTSSIEFNLDVTNAHSQTGSIAGIARLDNDKAVYTSDNCELLLQFDKENVQIIQNQSGGTCYAPKGMTYDGFYEKKS